MAEATRPGSKAERIRQAQARIEALKPASETCGKCQTLVTDFEPVDVRRRLGVRYRTQKGRLIYTPRVVPSGSSRKSSIATASCTFCCCVTRKP
jgi:hypothetical protein